LGTLSGVFEYGSVAVLVFFMISGFCIHYRQAVALATPREREPVLNLGLFAWRRIRRLWPPLVFALAITAVCDMAGSALYPLIYSGQSPLTALNEALRGGDHYSVTTLAGNLLMQGSLGVPQFGTDVPLWSLACEVWFYALYPLLLPVSRRWGPAGVLVVGAAVSAAAVLLRVAMPDAVPYYVSAPATVWIPRVLSFWVVWCVGVAVADVYTGRARLRLPGVLPIAVLPCFAVAALGAKVPAIHEALAGMGATYLWSFGLAVLFAYLMLALPRRAFPWVERTAARFRFAGDVSYSLYLVHYPVMVLFCAWWLSRHADLPMGVELAAAAVAASGAIAVCGWYLVERHFVSRRAPGRGVTAPSSAPLPSLPGAA
jgi:peptidoglycan/LPS O-acetylase OafA/YrhL